MFVSVPYTMFCCSSSLYIPIVDEENGVLRYIVRNEVKDAENMEILPTEEGINEDVDVSRNVNMLKAHARLQFYDA